MAIQKTAELTGAALDWAVARCEEFTGNYWVDDAGLVNWETDEEYGLFAPSTDWAQGGPIIDRERIEIGRQFNEWIACINVPENGDWESTGQYGETPLEAAMRSYVASKLGGEIEVPDELLS